MKSYRDTYSGSRLLEKYSLNEYGLWQIKGEDPNCDWGGSHYQPDLGIYEGRLKDIITLAEQLPNFWTWGGGGDIIKLNPPEKVTVDTIKERKVNTERIAALEKRISRIEEKSFWHLRSLLCYSLTLS